MDTTSSNDFRRRLGGAALVAAPLVVLAAGALHPKEVTDAGRQLEIVAGGLNRWYLAHLLYCVGFGLFVPAVLALGGRLRAGAPRLEVWGTALAVTGLVASAGLVATEGFGAWQLAQASDRASAAETFDRLVHSAGVFVPLGVLGLALPAGLIVLAVGLAKTATAPSWVAWSLASGALLIAAGLVAALQPVLVAGLLATAAALGKVGLDDLGGRSPSAAPIRAGRLVSPSGVVG